MDPAFIIEIVSVGSLFLGDAGSTRVPDDDGELADPNPAFLGREPADDARLREHHVRLRVPARGACFPESYRALCLREVRPFASGA
jgi:hypothetical protein